jgi:DNA-binding SARP family transcriptional activator/tetratricopeptide (TPR) repeat protein
MEFFLLGSVEVRDSGGLVDVGHTRQRHVLAVLLAEPNRVVEVDQLVDRVWGRDRLPADPVGALQTYISLLRRVFARSGELTIIWRSPGYMVVADEQAVDLHRFHGLITRAGRATDEHAAALLEEGLGLWRGEPFAGLDTPWATDVRAVLAAHRHAARLELADIRLQLGQHAIVLPRLAAQAAEHPLDERVAGQLMLALYRSGRQADATARYERIRGLLAEELGADPGPALRRLHQQILSADPALAVRARAAPARARPGVPRQLPAPPPLFTGRASELARLTAGPGGDGDPAGLPGISVVSGAGGVGKSWLALHWAHQHLELFPDGQLWVNLGGFAPAGEPVPAQTALRGFLDGLGVDPATIPAELEAAAALYRSVIAGKRMLVVLDNAATASQVIPLLPGSTGCAVLITSRRMLTGLVIGHGARSLNLDVLPGTEARELLARHLGVARLAAEPEATAELLASCAGLPLAISITAARAAAHPGFPLAVVAAELREAATRLDTLEAADLTASVRATLSWSYHSLAPRAARVLGLLALAPGPGISLLAAASLTALTPAAARTTLRELEAVSLLHEDVPDHHRMHDLIRLHAAEQAGHDQPEAERTAARQRVIDFYLHTAVAAGRLLTPHRAPVELSPPAAGCIPYQPADVAAALAWLDTEHSALLAAQTMAITQGWHSRAWQLAWALSPYHQRQGDSRSELVTWQAGLTAAGHLRQPALEADARRWLGEAYGNVGLRAEALDQVTRALALAERLGDTARQAVNLWTMASIWEQQQDYHQALLYAIRSHQLFQTLDDPVREASALTTVGWYQARLGRLSLAATASHAALAMHRRHHYRAGEAGTLDTLGFIAARTGHTARAISYYNEAIAICHEVGHRRGESDILTRLAEVHAARGRYDDARSAWQRALALYQAQHRTIDAARVQQKLAPLGR